MRFAIISVTEKGRILSEKIYDIFSEKHTVKRFCFEKNSDEFSEKFSDIYEVARKAFSENNALIFICSCGIAARSVAPLINSKVSDLAVIVIDDCGKFVIPILSGHIGGANRISEIIAENISAIPIITTATDVGGRFSPDSFAVANDLIITDINAAKSVAATVLHNEKIGIKSDYPYKNIPCEISENHPCRVGICISSDTSEKPFEVTLNLVPKNIVVGIGCKKNTPLCVIKEQVEKAFENAKIDVKRICAAATIDVKSEEAGLLEYCENTGIPLYTYTADDLMNVEGNFEKSEFVLQKIGADNVCERSAVKCSGGKLIIKKYAENGVTAAAAEMPVTLDFERRIL